MTLTYELTDVETALSYLFNGGKQWRREDAPDADMPKAKGNPSRQNTHLAVMIDARWAIAACMERGWLRNPGALYQHYARGMTHTDIAKFQGITRQSVAEAIAVDSLTIRDAMNEGHRPSTHPRVAFTPALKGIAA